MEKRMTRFIQRNRDIPNTQTQLDIIHRHDDGANEARKYIADIYLKTYKATISPSPDVIICSRDTDTKKIVACAGITFASQHEQLFSERYLPDLLEPLIQQCTDHRLYRHQLVEIGALASDNPNAAADLIRALPIIAWFMGAMAILCTSTHRLRKLLNYHQIPFQPITDASPLRLSEQERQIWGSYYDQSPQTGVILLSQCGHLFEHFSGRLMMADFNHMTQASQAAA
ncbi:thermostable hemolysin [Dickeya dadantii]|uniref:thermostable hemolysin n=1 Tax=Dickeya dadantii TaxID=204038 RepID=UPI001FD5D5B9|nr:thermostable hemolysin [Dickeya dadantii]